MRAGDTPVPIPNTMVKTRAADGTALETMWESRWLPETFFKKGKGSGMEKNRTLKTAYTIKHIQTFQT